MDALIFFIKQTIHEALTAEVTTTPKPGLVDCNDSGAHTDMDYRTFAASTEAITPHLLLMFEAGLTWTKPDDLNGLFGQVRRLGIVAEQAMFAATEGINTHKGMIFSMGTIAAAAGFYYQTHKYFAAENILLLAGQLCAGAMAQDFAEMAARPPKTHGEILYTQYGYRGIRGEAADGFPAIRTISFPYLCRMLDENREPNRTYINTLFHLMAYTDDTNVLIRTSPDTLRYMKNLAGEFLTGGGAFQEDAMAQLAAMNRDFIARNISPGGCADLLAVTIFLWKLEQYVK